MTSRSPVDNPQTTITPTFLIEYTMHACLEGVEKHGVVA
jgi:hypothetical protein